MPFFTIKQLRYQLVFRFLSSILALHMFIGYASAHAPMIKYPEFVKQECASCHVVFPPGALHKDSWRRIMSTLDKHYGTDASMDEQTTKKIAQWLEENAGTFKRITMDPVPENRITKSPWFIRKHREIEVEIWKRPSIKTPSNCIACHGGANESNFDEHQVKIPK